jgi:sugar lactone lactonase YvrE
LLVLSLVVALASSASSSQFPRDVTFSTLITTPLAIEGLTADGAGNLYTVGRGSVGTPCKVWRIDATGAPALIEVGFVPAPSSTTQCRASGLAFNAAGELFVVDGDAAKIFSLVPSDASPTAVEFASGVPGTNGLAFDRDGNLWTGDGTTNQGRVWKITLDGTVTEMFRIQPMRNGAGVGRQATTFPGSAQDLVANGLAFDESGTLFVADTARGAIWRVELNDDGTPRSSTGCDTTFTANTLCLDAIYVTDPRLEGADGIALDRAGNIWVDANERNAIVIVTRPRRVVELFRNPPVASLRNAGPLEFPTSPFLSGHVFCTAHSDGNRRDNSPNNAVGGEIGGAGQPRGKISCMDQRLAIPGLPLPIRHRE